MSDLSANLALPYLAASQAQKHVTHNEALRILDAVVQLGVADRDRTEPPAAPAEGDRHIVAEAATGAWAGQDGRIAVRTDTVWTFLAPRPGWRAWIASEAAEVVWTGAAWEAPPLPGLDNLDGVGVNTASDAVNRLAVAAEATLLTHAGAGHRLKINKAAPGDTASLVFQSGWSGRAEMGLAGGDGWSVKVSADGAAWTEALALDPVTGRASGAAVQTDATDATAGRLMTVGAFGLGGTGAAIGVADVDDSTLATGFYRLEAGAAGTLPASLGGAGLILQVHRYAATVCVQQIRRAHSIGGGVWQRICDGSWGSWVQVMPEVIGTVGQSSGAVTGALIERGSNANGDYAKFADGMLVIQRICSVDVNSNAEQTFIAAAPSFHASDTAAGFMSPFGNMQAVDNFIGGGRVRLAGTGTIALRWRGAPGGAVNNSNILVTLIGRWF
jgi:hypothetical protein